MMRFLGVFSMQSRRSPRVRRWQVWFSPYLLAVALAPAFVQIDYTGCAYYGNSRLSELELIVDGENRVVGFDPHVRSYQASFPFTSEVRVRAVTEDPEASVSIFVLPEGESLTVYGERETYLDVGIGGSDFVVPLPRGAGVLQVWVAPVGGATDYYEVTLDIAELTPEVVVEQYAARIEALASDELGGRLPGQPGADLAVEYLVEHFERAGLEPAYPAQEDGYLQHVPLVRTEVVDATPLTIGTDTDDFDLMHMEDLVVWSHKTKAAIEVTDAELVFAGYGIVAPEYGWDDYGDVDVDGKVVLVLEGEPPSNSGDFFAGDAFTTYWAWDYRFSEAFDRGAAGIFQLITNAFGVPTYGFWGGPKFAPVADEEYPAPDIEGVISEEAFRSVIEAGGLDYQATIAAAQETSFEAIPLGIRASMSWTNATASLSSPNVIGVVPGSVRPDEAVVFIAHWDHMGTDPDVEGDGIFNGAADNAMGAAALIEIAESIASLDPAPERTTIIIATTAEEKGFRGAYHYVANPLVAMNLTAAVLNIDSLGLIGPTWDLVAATPDSSELGDVLQVAAAARGMFLRPSGADTPFRGDQIAFAREGVPYLWFWNGIAHVENGPIWGRARNAELANYHLVSDEYDAEEWDLRGAVQAIELYIEVGVEVANTEGFPQWSPQSVFQRPEE